VGVVATALSSPSVPWSLDHPHQRSRSH